MVPAHPSRRRLLRAGTAGLAVGLAGCSSLDPFSGDRTRYEYALDVDDVDAGPVEHALYETSPDDPFDRTAREALDAVLPEGRYTSYGYPPLPEDAYVEHRGRYYRTAVIVTGRREMDRTVVRAESVPQEEVPPDAPLVDDLPRVDARVVKVLHSYTVSDGEGGAADLVEDGRYVLRRPAELEGRFASGELDGRVVKMDAEGHWASRFSVSTESVLETAHTALAVEVADSRAAFREVVFADRIDAELAPDDLDRAVRRRLERTLSTGGHRETTPLPEPFERLLERLGVADVDEPGVRNGRLLWYDDRLYRYGLYVDEAD